MKGNVSRLGYWVGWLPPVVLMFLLLPIWLSIWAYIPSVGSNISYLGYVFIAIAIAAAVLHFVIPKKNADWRFQMYLVMVVAIIVAIYLIGTYYNWFTTTWF